jgi:hypothetical protein
VNLIYLFIMRPIEISIPHYGYPQKDSVLEINKYYADSSFRNATPYNSRAGCYVETIFMVFQVIEHDV